MTNYERKERKEMKTQSVLLGTVTRIKNTNKCRYKKKKSIYFLGRRVVYVRIPHGSHGGDVAAASFWIKKFHRSISAARSLYRRNFSHAWHCNIIISTVSIRICDDADAACSVAAACAFNGNVTNDPYTAACCDAVEFNNVVDIFNTSPHARRTTNVRSL